jgi:hypothetical protein
MEYGETCVPGRMATLCKILTVIDVKLFMVQSVATRIKSINQSIKREKINEFFFKPLQNEAQAVNGFGSNGRKYVVRL